MIDHVAFPAKQDVEAPVAKPTPFPRQLAESPAQRFIIPDAGPVPDSGRWDPGQPTGPPLRDREALL